MNLRIFSKNSSIVAATFTALTLMAAPQDSQATTFANTVIENTVTVGYKSAGNQTYSASAKVLVTVNLVKVAPTLTFLRNDPVATLAEPTDEATPVVQYYSIISNANGLVQYTLNSATYGPTDISAATALSSSGPHWLGATTLGVKADGTNVIYVPRDTCISGTPATCNYTATTDTIGGANGIIVDDFVMIGSTKYKVTAIDNSATAANDLVSADYTGQFAKLTLDAVVPNTVLPGTQIGEWMEITASLTTGILANSKTSGSYAGSITATDGTNTSDPATTSAVYVARCNLSIMKSVSKNNGTNWTDSGVGVSGTPGLAATTTSDPGVPLLYKITVTNTTSKICNTVSITDAMSPYIAFEAVDPVAANLTLTPLTNLSTLTFDYKDQTGTPGHTLTADFPSVTPVYDTQVGSWIASFAGTMDGNSAFTITYKAWVY